MPADDDAPLRAAGFFVCFAPFGMVAGLGWLVRAEPAAVATRPAGAASLVLACLVTLAVGALVTWSQRLDRRALVGGLFGVGAAIWVEPWVFGLPSSLGSAWMPCLALAVPLAVAYVMARIATDRSLDRVVSRARSTTAALAALASSATLAWASSGVEAEALGWRESHRYQVPEDVRVTSILVALGLGALVLAAATRVRREHTRVASGIDAVVSSPGLAATSDGRTIVVPDMLAGSITVVERSSPRTTYRVGDRDEAVLVLAGPRRVHLCRLAERIQALDGLALAGVMTVAAPASADLSRRLLWALFTW